MQFLGTPIYRFVRPLLASLLVVCFLVSGCSKANKAQSPGASGEVLATINGQPIRTADLSNRARARMHQAESEFYRERMNAIESEIGNQILEMEAKKQNLKPEELQKREVEDKVPMVTDAEVDDYYTKNKDRIDNYLKNFKGEKKPSKAELKEAIRGQLAGQQQRDRYANYMKELRASYKVETFLKAPESPRINIATGDNPYKGSPEAKVKIIEFSDFACPYCAQVVPTLKKIEEEYGNKVQIVFRDFPLPMHATAFKQAEAGGCAQEQGKFWELHDKLFVDTAQTKIREAHTKQGLPGIEEELVKFGKEVGIDDKKFAECLKSKKFAPEVQADMKAADEAGIQSTPSFFINGRLVAGSLPFPEFKKIIDEELTK